MIRKIWAPIDALRLKAHACRWQTLPTIQPHLHPHTDDDREFDSDIAYLRDLLAAIVDMSEGQPIPLWPTEFSDQLAELEALAGEIAP